MKLSRCNDVSDLRTLANKKLPSPVFHFLDGGADDEVTLRKNASQFDNHSLVPRYLADVSNVDLTTTVLGCTIELPVVLSPTGMTRLFHHDAELAAARAAARCGTLYSLSTVSTTSLEDIAAATHGPKMFQIYIFRDRSLTQDLVARCKESGYDALCLTVDTPVAGNRQRDRVTGMTVPPKFGLRSLLSFASHPVWAAYALLRPDFDLANFSDNDVRIRNDRTSVVDYMNRQLDPSVTWKDAAWLADQWRGPLAIKGIQSPDDAKRAVDIGARAIVISNHGGRQLDGASTSLDSLIRIVDRVGNDLEIILDSGIRRGTHVIKALALGATACSIGRPYLYGLAAAGQAGVEHVLQLLRAELERDMALLGCTSIASIDSSHVVREVR